MILERSQGMRAALCTASLLVSFLAHSGLSLAGDAAGGWQTTVIRAAPPAADAHAGPAGSRSLATRTLGAHAVEGIASYYWQGEITASGEPYDKRALTAAHRTLPFNSHVRVTDKTSGKSVVVRINDRGPFLPGRVIDLSEAAAEEIDMTQRGLTPVRLEVLAGPDSTQDLR